MAASIKLLGRRAGGDPAPIPGRLIKGITKSAKNAQVQRTFFVRTCVVSELSTLTLGAFAEKCTRCHSLSSQPLCQACMLLEGLNKGVAKLELGGDSGEVTTAAGSLQAGVAA